MAVTGQLLTMSLGVQGGFREYEKKYSGKDQASEEYLALADGIDPAGKKTDVAAGSDSKRETVSEEMLFCPRRSSKMIFEPVFSRIERLTFPAVCKIIAAHRISVLITRKQENRTMLLLFFRRR